VALKDPLRWFGEHRPSLVHHDDAAWWKRVAEVIGEDAYVCKAAYVCGLVRQVVESAALLDAARRYLTAAQVLLGGVELLGRGLTGNTSTKGTDLEAGLTYLDNSKLLTDPPLDLDDWLAVRNFTAHGSAYIRAGIPKIDRKQAVRLTYLLALSLERYWLDAARRASFSRCTILPGWAGLRPVLVEDVLRHLRAGESPSSGLPTDLPFLEVALAMQWPLAGLRVVLADLREHAGLTLGYVGPIGSMPVTGFGEPQPSAWRETAQAQGDQSTWKQTGPADHPC
jgi:hypothetical protein